MIGALVTFRYRRRWLNAPGRKILNLGGGSNCIPECLTVDIDPRADVYVDITQSLPFSGDSIDAVFCEEVIEHIEPGEAMNMLAECFRVLKPDGVIRITTPDPAASVGETGKPAVAGDVKGFDCHGHKHIYTREELALCLEDNGFVDVMCSFYRAPASKLGFLDSHPLRFSHSPEISQYVEAGKPADGRQHS